MSRRSSVSTKHAPGKYEIFLNVRRPGQACLANTFASACYFPMIDIVFLYRIMQLHTRSSSQSLNRLVMRRRRCGAPALPALAATLLSGLPRMRRAQDRSALHRLARRLICCHARSDRKTN